MEKGICPARTMGDAAKLLKMTLSWRVLKLGESSCEDWLISKRRGDGGHGSLERTCLPASAAGRGGSYM